MNTESEKNALSESTAVARVMADMMEHIKQENRWLRAVVVALAVSWVILAGCAIWAITNAQNVANEAMLNALNSVAEIGVTEETTTTTTTTQTVDGDNATINNGEWEQYNDNAAKYEGAE